MRRYRAGSLEIGIWVNLTSARTGKWLNRVVQGYFNYHAVPGNLYRLGGMHSEICRAWRHALMRRSQRHRLPWARFSRIAKRFIPTHETCTHTRRSGSTRHIPEAGAVCGNSARTDLCGGRGNLRPYRNP